MDAGTDAATTPAGVGPPAAGAVETPADWTVPDEPVALLPPPTWSVPVDCDALLPPVPPTEAGAVAWALFRNAARPKIGAPL
jgi:hypothetical protein